jgi:hypothetical protein
MRTILDDINDLLNLGVGQTVRLQKIKATIQSKKPLWSADIHYVEELSRSFLQNKKKSGMLKNEKMIIIGTVLAIGFFFVFAIIPLPENDMTQEKLTLEDSIAEETPSEEVQSKTSDIESGLEIAPSPEDKIPDYEESSINNQEFSSANIIQSSSSTPP